MISAQEAAQLAQMGPEAPQLVNDIDRRIQENILARHLDVPAPPHLLPRLQEFLVQKGFVVTRPNPTMLSISW